MKLEGHNWILEDTRDSEQVELRRRIMVRLQHVSKVRAMLNVGNYTILPVFVNTHEHVRRVAIIKVVPSDMSTVASLPCQGLPNKKCPLLRCDATVRNTIYDLFLCRDCERIRIQENLKLASSVFYVDLIITESFVC
jgi:hypothetical protein